MPHNAGSYIDGNRGLVYRSVNGLGTNIDPHTSVIAPHDDFTAGVGIKSFNVEESKYTLKSYTFAINVGINILDNVIFDCTKLKILSVKINNSTVVLNDFVVVGGINRTAGWDDLANSDYHYTSGQGENTGNSMTLVRKCSPVNPRTLQSGASTWLVLNVEPYQYIYIRVNALATGNLTFYNYGVFI